MSNDGVNGPMQGKVFPNYDTVNGWLFYFFFIFLLVDGFMPSSDCWAILKPEKYESSVTTRPMFAIVARGQLFEKADGNKAKDNNM